MSFGLATYGIRIQLMASILTAILYTYSIPTCVGQQGKDSKERVFESPIPLPLKFSYSNKQMRKQASTEVYLKSKLHFMQNKTWDSIAIELKARGNFRRANCYFPPIKIKIKASRAKGTLFEGFKKMKVVLPCLLQKRSNDDVLKEYLAYKLYEPISPVHFKTRLVDLEFIDDPKKKEAEDPLAAIFIEFNANTISAQNDSVFTRRKAKTYHLRAILIEDDKNVAKRNDGKVLDRFVHPLAQDATASVRNAFFQFMIGNTDFSTAYSHNQKLLFIKNKTVPLPYDFDMSGIVDASYSVVSNINDQNLSITEVTQRLYRGFKRDQKTMQQVRTEFLDRKPELLKIMTNYKSAFDNQKTYQKTKKFLEDFFMILESESRFKSEILNKARTK